ncbi:erythromycin esterase family protein [Sorangium sp. So ce117]|uniref:erythromycin esterase family protein n=1 Tax=Sorangium sp. So ce117 TaxID=3133277 RepID=UPI003F5E1763
MARPRRLIEPGTRATPAFDRWPTWMWANEEVADLVEWLRRHNPPARDAGCMARAAQSALGEVNRCSRYNLLISTMAT